MPTTWPDQSEFADFLVASGLYGITPTAMQSRLDLQGALDGAVDMWNDRTKFWPFLSTGVTTEERRFDPPTPSGLLDFNSGLLTVTSFTVDVTYGNPTGNSRTALQDYWLKPSDAAPRKKPWTYAVVRQWYSHYPQSFVVVGEWGYCTAANLPSAARIAVMALAAQELMPQIERSLRPSAGLKMLQEGDSQKEWSTVTQTAGAVWDEIITGALAQYTRLRVA